MLLAGLRSNATEGVVKRQESRGEQASFATRSTTHRVAFEARCIALTHTGARAPRNNRFRHVALKDCGTTWRKGARGQRAEGNARCAAPNLLKDDAALVRVGAPGRLEALGRVARARRQRRGVGLPRLLCSAAPVGQGGRPAYLRRSANVAPTLAELKTISAHPNPSRSKSNQILPNLRTVGRIRPKIGRIRAMHYVANSAQIARM